jgi:ribose 5-phosphate isomerase B
MMKIAIGADHRGYELKTLLMDFLAKKGHQVDNLGTNSSEPVDYPVFAERVALAVKEGRANRGIVICGSGVGASVAANKLPGIRAAMCHDTYSAHQGVEHDDVNVLVLGSRVVGDALAFEVVTAFLQARFSGEARHQKRLDQVRDLERKYAGSEARAGKSS